MGFHHILVLAAVVGAQVATIADLQADLDRIPYLEAYSLAELMELVGVAWGYNVSETGVATLADGTFDLGAV